MTKRLKQVQVFVSQAGQMLAFLNVACDDYLAARILLLSGLGLQGAIMASTAVERYCKAILTLHGIVRRGHLRKALVNEARNYERRLFASINESFLSFLAKCYRARYPDVLPVNFNLVVVNRKVLAELDFTVSQLQEMFTTMRLDGKPALARYHGHVQCNSPQLFAHNHMLLGLDKTAFIEQVDSVYEMRIVPKIGPLEVHYTASTSKNDGDFSAEAIVQDPQNPLSFKLHLAPLKSDIQE